MANKFLRDLDSWPAGTLLPATALLLAYVPELDKEFTLTPDQVPGGAGTGTDVDLLGLTNPQMVEVMEQGFDANNDGPLVAPAWSRFGMFFDAIDQAGDAWHFYCGRGNFQPYGTNAPGEGATPRWSRVTKAPI